MTATTTLTQCVIYTRVSKKRPGEAQRSPEEQHADLLPIAKANGWRVAKVLTDAIGATRHTRKERAGWPAVLDAIRAGGVDVLLVWEVSRLTRNEREWLDFADLCEATDTKVAVGGHVYNLGEPQDRMILGQLVNFAAFEAAMTRKRSMRGQSANLATGMPAGRVLFGYRRIRDPHTGALLGQEIDPVLGPVVREIFDRVANGDSVRSVQNDLTRRGVPASSVKHRPGEVKPWPRTSLGNILRNRSYLGQRTHHGRVVMEGAWPALVDARTFERVQAILADPTRRTRTDNRTKHLLAGIIRCEVCGGRVTHKGARQRNAAHYRCQQGGHVAASAARLEAGVRELLVTWLAAPDALDVWAENEVDTAGLTAELKALEARLDEVADAVKAGEMSARMAGGIERDLEPRIAEIKAALDAAGAEVPACVVAVAGPDAAEKWDALDLEAKRAIIRVTMRDCVLRRAHRDARVDLGLRFRWAAKTAYEV